MQERLHVLIDLLGRRGKFPEENVVIRQRKRNSLSLLWKSQSKASNEQCGERCKHPICRQVMHFNEQSTAGLPRPIASTKKPPKARPLNGMDEVLRLLDFMYPNDRYVHITHYLLLHPNGN